MPIEREGGGYSATVKAWVEMGGPIPEHPFLMYGVAKTNGREFCTSKPAALAPGDECTLVVSVDGVEHRRRIRIKGGVLWEYETIEELEER